jgi:hypothetical protein
MIVVFQAILLYFSLIEFLNGIVKAETCGLYFDGIDDSLSFYAIKDQIPVSNYTVSVWFKNSWKASYGHIDQVIFTKGFGHHDWYLSISLY